MSELWGPQPGQVWRHSHSGTKAYVSGQVHHRGRLAVLYYMRSQWSCLLMTEQFVKEFELTDKTWDPATGEGVE